MNFKQTEERESEAVGGSALASGNQTISGNQITFWARLYVLSMISQSTLIVRDANACPL